ncbi:MAG: hypothetical protein RLZZ312_1273 [Bacteroidota bacterium]|jgi:hypothetical protein
MKELPLVAFQNQQKTEFFKKGFSLRSGLGVLTIDNVSN